MYHRRIIVAFATVFTLGLGAGVANAGDEEPKPCKSPTLPKVKAACKKGGEKQAKSLMKKLSKKLKESGAEKSKCFDCHPKGGDKWDQNLPGAEAALKSVL